MISNNTKKIKAAITAIGGYVPDDFISNKDLEKMVDTNDEWITARTGIRKRRILKEKGKATSYLAINAANDLIKKKKLILNHPLSQLIIYHHIPFLTETQILETKILLRVYI